MKLNFDFLFLLIDSVVQETSRVSSGVFMVRYITKDTWFKAVNSDKEFLMREGDRVALYPPAIHQDPEIFENPKVCLLKNILIRLATSFIISV